MTDQDDAGFNEQPDEILEEQAEKKPNHYVDNQQLYLELCGWHKFYVEWADKVVRKCETYHTSQSVEEHTKQCKSCRSHKPPLPEYVGEALLKIARHLSYKASFINYSYREDMIGDAVENCIQYIHNFDPGRPNVFAYFTQTIYNAFIRRIKREKRELYIKAKIVQKANIPESYERQTHDTNEYQNTCVRYLQENADEVIKDFEEKRKRKKKSKQEKTSLKVFFVDEAVEGVVEN